MSTHARIVVHRRDGRYAYVHCQFDGYLTGVGQTLHDHHNDADRAETLVALGDLSSLGDAPETSVFYGCDRGETGVEARVRDSLDDALEWAMTVDYVYLWDDGWWVLRRPGWVPLGAVLAAGEAR